MSLELVDQCPVCSGRTFKPFLICKDHTASGELFHVEQCPSCGLSLTNPRPSQKQSASYYQSPQYISHTSKASGLIDYIYLIIRQFTINWKYNLIKPYLAKRHLLDVGCGTGKFLRHCKHMDIDVYGVEPSQEAREQSVASGIPVVESLEKLPGMKFNVITLWHVLEHIYDLPATLENLKNRLDDNGIIFIAVPNWQSSDSNHYKEFWAGYDVPRHLWHFSKPAMIMLMEQAGLKLKKIIPMKLDAYYVSLLSTKYKANKLTIFSAINALWIGFQSNQKARTEMNYSSLIYLVQK